MVRVGGWLVVLLVAACGAMSRVQATGATADGVTYQFPAGQQDEARRQAMLYCANLGRSAAPRSAKAEGDGLVVAVYDCR